MSTAPNQPHFKRVLGLPGLLFYGIVVIQPTAPLGSFGIVSVVANGHVVTTLMFGMLAMVLTAVSYGRMANVYPSAGSAYTFVGRAIHPNLGFLVGWCIMLDYMLLPTIGTIWCAKAAQNVLQLPYELYVVGFAAAFTVINLRGIQATTRTNVVVTIGLLAVIAAFLIAAASFVTDASGVGGLFSTKPFYDPAHFSWKRVSAGTSIAVLTYMGFDCISTLSEDVKDPRRNILLATVLLCVITGVLGGLQVYAGELVWPDYSSYPDPDTAFVAVAGRAGGPAMYQTMNVALLVATVGSSLGAQLGAARLLFAMGRDGVLPRSIFGHLSAGRRTPTYNILILFGVIVVGSLFLSYQAGTELVNFGAFIAFIGVNLSVMFQYYGRQRERGARSVLLNILMPAVAVCVCLYIWLSLREAAKIAGFCWLAAGVVYCALQTNMFKNRLPSIDSD